MTKIRDCKTTLLMLTALQILTNRSQTRFPIAAPSGAARLALLVLTRLSLLLLAPTIPLISQTPDVRAVTFRVQLTWDNASCVTGSACYAAAYRAICNPTCPQYGQQPGQFIKLPAPDSTNSSQSVSATGTHFTYFDNDKATAALQYATTYAYAVTNSFQANPSVPSTSLQIPFTTPTGVHTATINWSSTACRITSPCTLQVYRATCTSPTSCPAYTAGSSAWLALPMDTGHLTTTATAQSTAWVYQDNGSSFTGNTTFAWIATASYTGFASASPASTAFIGTTGVGRDIEIHSVPINQLKETTK